MSNNSIKAIDAIQEAHKIAFSPFVFQAVVCLRKLGVFDIIFEKRKHGGCSIYEIADELSVSEYGIGVLLEITESSRIVYKSEEDKYSLTTIGYFLNNHETVDVNINFTNDVCYEGLFNLYESIQKGKPEGLKALGEWSTIYEGLSQLEPRAQKSWFDFDHHYSDNIFEEAMPIVFKYNPKLIFDVGANTGKFAISACTYNDQVNLKLIDLPGQLEKALENIKINNLENRVSGHEIDWLSENPKLPLRSDLIWMCQFLDCFSEEEIRKILTVCIASMDADSKLLIMETFTDRQKFDSAKFILEATSLYFTSMANGNSKMYKAVELINLIKEVGLELVEDLKVGEYHTVLVCKKVNNG